MQRLTTLTLALLLCLPLFSPAPITAQEDDSATELAPPSGRYTLQIPADWQTMTGLEASLFLDLEEGFPLETVLAYQAAAGDEPPAITGSGLENPAIYDQLASPLLLGLALPYGAFDADSSEDVLDELELAFLAEGIVEDITVDELAGRHFSAFRPDGDLVQLRALFDERGAVFIFLAFSPADQTETMNTVLDSLQFPDLSETLFDAESLSLPLPIVAEDEIRLEMRLPPGWWVTGDNGETYASNSPTNASDFADFEEGFDEETVIFLATGMAGNPFGDDFIVRNADGELDEAAFRQATGLTEDIATDIQLFSSDYEIEAVMLTLLPEAEVEVYAHTLLFERDEILYLIAAATTFPDGGPYADVIEAVFKTLRPAE